MFIEFSWSIMNFSIFNLHYDLFSISTYEKTFPYYKLDLIFSSLE